jgi:hypothetical protein
LGYAIPHTSVSDPSSLRDLECVLKHYIADLEQELRVTQEQSTASSALPLTTLVEMLSNLKQQSLRLRDQKGQLLMCNDHPPHQPSLHRQHPILHVDTDKNSMFESSYSSSFDGNNIR